MANTALLARGYSRGIKRDASRDQLPAGALWNLVDYIPNVLGAPLRKRGGWGFGSDAFGAGSYAAACAFADFTGGSQLIGINDAGELYTVNPATGAVTDKGAARVPVAHTVLHRDTLVIPSPDGALSVKRYDGSAAPADLAATAPAGTYAAVYKDRTILAAISGQLQRVFFGPGGLPTAAWDTANSYLDASFPVRGLAAMRNVIIVFGRSRSERIRGTTPPPNTDMVREPLFDVGCIDARTIVPFGDNVIFANEQGIWMTDGAIPENLAEASGLLPYWIETMAAYTSSWTLAAGLHRGLYVISIMNGSAFVDAIALDVNDRSWFRVSNLTVRMFARALGTSEELYFALRDDARLGKLSTIFNPGDSVRNDADGSAVLPIIETPFYKDRPTLKRWHNAYLNYMLAAPSTAAELELSYITTPEATAYTALSPTFAELAAVDRKRVPLRFRGRGVAFKLRQTAASADTRIHELEGEMHQLEGSR